MGCQWLLTTLLTDDVRLPKGNSELLHLVLRTAMNCICVRHASTAAAAWLALQEAGSCSKTEAAVGVTACFADYVQTLQQKGLLLKPHAATMP